MKGFGLHIPIYQPCEISWKDDSVLSEFAQKVYVECQENLDDAVIKEIVKTAKAEGITDLVLLNKPAIIDALRKQTAMKPKIRKFGFKSVYYACPCCEQRLISKIDGEFIAGQKYYHCYRCGQKLDWSEEE